MLRLGLTGGIGSGKSTVARLLQVLGAALVDADAISRALTDARGLAIDPIRASFGTDFIAADGALNRHKMRALAFADATARQRLEAIIHPLVNQQAQAQTQLAIQACKPCTVFDVPLLVESGRWRAQLDAVLVLDCTEETQIQRVLSRSGHTRSEVQAILATQASRAQRLRAADFVLFNDDLSLQELAAAVAQIAPSLRLSGYHPKPRKPTA